VVGDARDHLGGLDSVVYAAGVSGLGPVVETPKVDWDRIFETNVTGYGLVFSAAAKDLSATRGQMVGISSAAVKRPKPGLLPYAASKAALATLVEGLRTEHPEIAFTIVTIGATYPTEFGRDFDRALHGRLKEQWASGGFLAPGAMTADDVAERILQCIAAPMRTEHLDLVPRPDPNG
jgi:NAD(P)-dependent dehydrogenase (short-subunit alcohol dehydrogenase family)